MKPHEYSRPRILNREPDKCANNITTSEEKQPKIGNTFYLSTKQTATSGVGLLLREKLSAIRLEASYP
jgi:hypothetical protein